MKWQDINNHWRRHENKKEKIEIDFLKMPYEVAIKFELDKLYPKYVNTLKNKS